MGLDSAIDIDLLTYYDTKASAREDKKINAMPLSKNRTEYIKQYFNTHRDGKLYGVKFAYTAANVIVPAGTKYGANAGLVVNPSTRTVAGRNDYESINLFKHFDANAHLDDNGNTIIDAIVGDEDFSYTGEVDVVCVFAPVYEKVYTGYENGTKYLYVEWCDTPRDGFILNLLCRDGQGNNKGFYVISKYQAGLINSKPYASAGLYPMCDSASSYNLCIDKYRTRHAYMCAMTMAEVAIIQRMFLMKYGNTNMQSYFNGLSNYNYKGYATLYYVNAAVDFAIITTAQVGNLATGSRISIGTSNARGKNHHNVINNTEILSKDSNVVSFASLTTTGFTIVDETYTLVTIPASVFCNIPAATTDAVDLMGNEVTATFNNGTDDITVTLKLNVSGSTYTLYAYDENDNEIGHSTAGTKRGRVYMDKTATMTSKRYIATAIYKTGYSSEIRGSDGCYMKGAFASNARFPSVFSGIELFGGTWDVIGNVVFEYDENTNPHVLLCNDPSMLTKTAADISETYTDIGYYTHTNTTDGSVYESDVHYDLINGGYTLDCGAGTSTTGLCDGSTIKGVQTSGQYSFLAFGTNSSGTAVGPWYSYLTQNLAYVAWNVASRPSLGGPHVQPQS